jgi:hypothetical protein
MPADNGQWFLLIGAACVAYALVLYVTQWFVADRAKRRAHELRVEAAESPSLQETKDLTSQATKIENRLSTYRTTFNATIVLVLIVAVVLLSIGGYRTWNFARNDMEQTKSFTSLESVPGLSEQTMFQADTRSRLNVGDSSELDVTLRPLYPVKCPGKYKYSIELEAPQMTVSHMIKQPITTCELRWHWILVPKSVGRQTILLHLEARVPAKNYGFAILGPIVTIDVARLTELGTWVPWIVAVLGAIAALVTPVVSLFKRDAG